MHPGVLLQYRRLGELLPTDVTRERPLPGVSEMVPAQVEAVGELPATHGAAELLLHRVRMRLPAVTTQLRGRREDILTVFAGVISRLAVVLLPVFRKQREAGEGQSTRDALQRRGGRSRPGMRLQMILLPKRARAELTVKRLHTSMHCAMPLQIVLIPELFVAYTAG